MISISSLYIPSLAFNSFHCPYYSPEIEHLRSLFSLRRIILFISVVANLPVLSTSSSKSKMPSNAAAWLTAAKVNPLKIKPAPYTFLGEHEIVIKNGAVAINPVDRAIQDLCEALFPWITYPCILGGDAVPSLVSNRRSCSGFYTRFSE